MNIYCYIIQVIYFSARVYHKTKPQNKVIITGTRWDLKLTNLSIPCWKVINILFLLFVVFEVLYFEWHFNIFLNWWKIQFNRLIFSHTDFGFIIPFKRYYDHLLVILFKLVYHVNNKVLLFLTYSSLQ